MWKLNVDAVVKGATWGWNCGAIIRDAAGQCYRALAAGKDGCWPVWWAEAAAVREGLKMVAAAGLERLVVETDSQTLVHYLSDGKPLVSWLGSILSDIFQFSLLFR